MQKQLCRRKQFWDEEVKEDLSDMESHHSVTAPPKEWGEWGERLDEVDSIGNVRWVCIKQVKFTSK